MHDVARRVFDEALFRDRNVVLFEDKATEVDLFPLAVLRPSWEIRCGAGSTRIWLTNLPGLLGPLLLRPREGMEALANEVAGFSGEDYVPAAETVFVNGRLISALAEEAAAPEIPETVTDAKGRVILARRSGTQAEHLINLSGNDIANSLVKEGGTPLSEVSGWSISVANYVWDYMANNPMLLERQLTGDRRGVPELMGAHIVRELPVGVHLTDRTAGYPIYLGSSAKLQPCVVLGNQNGPIWIGSHTEIEPHAYIEGPIYVGSHCRVKAGTRLYHGSAIGDNCRVAGEVSQSIFQGYVNKQHEGFVGNSHLGQWVNLGADTCTSNLRNDYREVKVKAGDRLVNTGQRFIGLLAGDHVKTGINTMFNTATVVGVAANVWGAGYPPHFIGSFQWGGADGLKAGSLKRTLETARIVMERRGCRLTAAEEELLRRHYAEKVNEEMQS